MATSSFALTIPVDMHRVWVELKLSTLVLYQRIVGDPNQLVAETLKVGNA
jgi:hypothetical protein